jgi:phosphodiesterase/alkaline phosphatase D-like protein
MLDTRTQRNHRPIGKPEDGRLMSLTDANNLREWLIKNKNKIKFIITPSILLPRKLAFLNKGTDEASRSDSWDGYPTSMEWLLDTIVVEGITNTVFLSGDEHLSVMPQQPLESTAWLPK